eukprot:2281392-Heterocapsa_arctica.AAC.1
MLDAKQKRGVTDSFDSPDERDDAAITDDIPSTKRNFHPRIQRRWSDTHKSNYVALCGNHARPGAEPHRR